jgi:hypothetical protein
MATGLTEYTNYFAIPVLVTTEKGTPERVRRDIGIHLAFALFYVTAEQGKAALERVQTARQHAHGEPMRDLIEAIAEVQAVFGLIEIPKPGYPGQEDIRIENIRTAHTEAQLHWLIGMILPTMPPLGPPVGLDLDDNPVFLGDGPACQPVLYALLNGDLPQALRVIEQLEGHFPQLPAGWVAAKRLMVELLERGA